MSNSFHIASVLVAIVSNQSCVLSSLPSNLVHGYVQLQLVQSAVGHQDAS